MASSAAAAVPALELADRTPGCPVCGAGDDVRRPILRLQVAPAVELVECGRCRVQSAERMPTSDFLGSLYDPNAYRSSLVSEAGISRRCARFIVAQAKFDPDREISILDYGGSDGSLSTAIRAALIASGHRAAIRSSVVELVPRPNTEHQRYLLPDDFEASADRYDLVLASAVLEHLPNPANTLRALVECAAPGAIFYARTPWDSPLQRVVPGYRVKWPRHLHDMGPDFWERFIELFGVAGRLIVSRPSIVETSFRSAPLRTALAHLAKLPARLESPFRMRRSSKGERRWRLVGGWEVMIRFDA